MGSDCSSVVGAAFLGKVTSWAWRSAFSSTRPAAGSISFCARCLGVRVSSVWGQGTLGARCLGVRVSSVWGQCSRCLGLGACCLGSGCPVRGVSAPAVCGLGVQCEGPGRLPCDRLELLELTPQEHVCPALCGLVGRRGNLETRKMHVHP